MNYICTKCGKTEPTTTLKPQCDCGGLWKLDYCPPEFDPARIDRAEWSMFRYRAFMPVEDDGWREVTLGEGMTPVIPLDRDVLLKMDYYMPTLSFKDRGAAMLLAHCKRIGVKTVMQDSSGNAGNSVAAYCGRTGVGCEIFVPEGTSEKKIAMIRAHGAQVHVIPGGRDVCADVCRSQVKQSGVYYASHVYNPYFYQGTKTYVYEVYEQLGRIPHNLFVPLGNGTLFLGMILALRHLLASGVISEFPQIFAVQSENCPPFATAVEKGDRACAVDFRPTPTMAEGIAIGKPMRDAEILSYIYEYGIKVVAAPEDGILPAREALAKRGIHCEHTTAATYAAYVAYTQKHGRLPDSLLPMCGAGLKSEH